MKSINIIVCLCVTLLSCKINQLNQYKPVSINKIVIDNSTKQIGYDDFL